MRKGFTLVEVLAVLVILGLLLILTVPAYTSIYAGIKRQNLQSKITEVKTAAKKYGETIKDEIKNTGAACYQTSIEKLIKDGYLVSDTDKDAGMLYKSDKEKMFGYNTSVICENNNYILTVDTSGSNVHDSVSFYDSFKNCNISFVHFTPYTSIDNPSIFIIFINFFKCR